ncbi:MAG: RNA polymerase sigma factor [Ardenticatenia bacterium]|nr:RNA polymerase sigma factor [Ardenticatenia bacterium]
MSSQDRPDAHHGHAPAADPHQQRRRRRPDPRGAVAAGDQRALETLYQRHGSACFGYLLRRLDGDRPAAEDLLQDLMLAAWRGAAAFRGDSEVRTWLLGIAHHLWQQELRRRSRRPRPSEDGEGQLARLHGEDPRPDEATAGGLRQAMDALPEDLRSAGRPHDEHDLRRLARRHPGTRRRRPRATPHGGGGAASG